MRDEDKFALREHPDGDSSTGKAFIGFWQSKTKPGLPDPKDYVDEDWDWWEKQRVADFFDAGKSVASYKGWSDCRLCGKPNGSADLGDGVFVWPSGLGHYVREHSVKPPAVIVQRALRAVP